MHIAVFGTEPFDREWFDALRAENQTVDRIDATNFVDALTQASTRFGDAAFVLLRAGTWIPPHFLQRVLAPLALDDVLVASPLDNIDVARSPLPMGESTEADATQIDALCYRYGRRESLQWPTFSTQVSAWNGAVLKSVDISSLRNGAIAPQFAPLRAMIACDLYVADPSRKLRGPQPDKPGADPTPPSPLGEMRERVSAALKKPSRAEYPGLDEKSVILHVIHSWGGGAERFVRDLASVDDTRHHLVFTARGNFDRRRFGETLALHDATLQSPPLRECGLSDPIASTAFSHRAYREFLDGILRDFRVDAILVSSLIGHSLDALRTNLPTTFFIHDFYPLWPLLHRNLDDDSVTFDAAQLTHDLAHADAGFEFAERDATFWLALRERFADELTRIRATLVAPTRAAMTLFTGLQPRLRDLPQRVIGHGMQPWTTNVALPLAAPPKRARLRFIVLGRVRRGKSAAMLRTLIPKVREHAEIFLIGAGPESEEFFGQRDVHILLNYRHDELPALLQRVAPDAALILPNFAETFSYTLSELNSFGIPVIATRLGALAERVRDGVDGFLVRADADDIAALIAHLHADRTPLLDARSKLARMSPRTLQNMADEYRDVLPPTVTRDSTLAIGEASIDRIAAQTRTGELAEASREISELRDRIAAQQKELVRRGEWGFDLDAQLKRAGKSIDGLHRQAQELQNEIDVRTAWALGLDADLKHTIGERDALLDSTSWRITQPLRSIMHRLRMLRARLQYSAKRLNAILHRTRGSLASRGVVGTFKRATDELRRATPIVTAPLVSEPVDDGSTFAVPTSESPTVSIVIPVYNKIAYTLACLKSLGEHAGDVAFEVIVVDDCSTDETSKRLNEIGGIRAIRNEANLGFVGSCNAGAAQARGEFVVFLNNDTVVTSEWLRALLDCFAREPDAGLVGAKLVYPDGRLQEAGGIVFSDGSGWNYGRFDDPADPRYNTRRLADYCSGAAIMLRKSLFERLGGFDMRYAPAYYEDTDLAFAVRNAGLKVFYEPQSVIVHFEGVTAGTDTNSGMKRYQVVNREKFVEKWKTQLSAQPAPIHETKLAERAANRFDRGHILIVDAYTPTPDQDSGSLRMVNLMRLLRELGYAVSFLPDNRAHAGKYTHAIQSLGVQALYHPFVSDPIAWLRDHGSELTAVILSRHYVAANYVNSVRLYAPKARLIFDTVDVHHLREQRAAELENNSDLAQQAVRTRAQELKLMRDADVTLVVSPAEKEILRRDAPQARIEVLSNVHEIFGRRRGFAERRDLVFVGGFQHPPNIDAVQWFVREVLPLVRARLPDVNTHIIGSKAPPSILELSHDGVTVHGYVADIAPYMDGCRLALAPLRYGAGVKGKVNMAMSYGLPVVATTPAVEGMHVRHGEDVLVADSPSDFADAIVRVYRDEMLWTKLSDNGLANVRAHFSFDAARESIRRILDGTRR